MKTHSALPQTKCFTLIELLTVVAIIAILAALLLPALARARYLAKNVICVSNQKQLVMGVFAYANDSNGCYPGPKNTDYNSSADMVIQNNTGTNYVEDLKPYFGSLKGTWTCPLAPANFQKGGGTHYSRIRDLDTTTAPTMTSYAHFYGRTKGIPGDNGYKPEWGTGAFCPDKPMRKVGQPFLAREFWSAEVQEYRVLTMDSMWLWNSSTLVYTHQTPGEPPIIGNDQYSRRKVNPHVAAIDMNYVLDDGSADTVRRITRYNRDITLMRYPSTWGWAWILPKPE